MKDNRTEEQKYMAWVNAVTFAAEYGWRHVCGWVFRAPSGSLHDLSAADLAQLNRIERECIFLAQEATEAK